MIVEKQNDKYLIKAENGFVLTNWDEGEDIRTFTYCSLMYCPLNFDYSDFKEIKKEEADEIEKRQQEEIEKELTSRKDE